MKLEEPAKPEAVFTQAMKSVEESLTSCGAHLEASRDGKAGPTSNEANREATETGDSMHDSQAPIGINAKNHSHKDNKNVPK